MIISINWLKKYTSVSGTIDELVSLIGSRLVEIESVIDLGAKYKDVVVAKVEECSKLEGSDHLSVVKIDDGGVVDDVERDEDGLVQVVCGAPNVRAGLMVAWLPPQSIVPETHGTSSEFTLTPKELRGVISNGMLASARELDLYDDHTGIIEIDKESKPGDSFAELYELNDYLLDIENKSLTHRPDTFGVIGFAREVAGIQGLPFNTPPWLEDINNVVDSIDNAIEEPKVAIEDPSLSDRFQAIVLSGVDESAKSSIQTQTYLARSGVRPINSSVDVSNYLMLLTGQPTHTYDYDKLKDIAGDDFTVRVRLANKDEKLVMLDGKEVELDVEDIVIAAGDKAVGLAGIMGGQSTAVDASTKRVLLEVATFNLFRMRSSQMRHGIFSEAVTRFTKGIPAGLGGPVLSEAVRMLKNSTGAQVASLVVEDYPKKTDTIVINLSASQVNETLGTNFSAEDIAGLLRNVGFSVEFDGLEASVVVPYWRQDVNIPEDIVEEVGRLAGYDTINPTLPLRDFTAVLPSSFDTFRSLVRKTLARAGANEVLTYSFVHGDLLQKSGQSTDNSYRIINSISPSLQYYRQSLSPSLLTNLFANVKSGYESFAIFELNKVHQKSDGLTEEGVPVENESVALVFTDSRAEGSAYYQAKYILEYLAGVLGVKLGFESLQGKEICARCAPFEPKRSAVVFDKKTGNKVGVVGEFKQSALKSFKAPSYTAGFDLDSRALFGCYKEADAKYRPDSRYPGIERDICFQVSSATRYADIIDTAGATLDELDFISLVEPVDIYQPEPGETKNITIRVKLASYQKTMTNEEANEVVNDVIKSVIRETGGKVI